MYEYVRETAKQPSLWAMLSGILASPYTVPVCIVGGVIGIGYLWLSGDDDEEDEPTVQSPSEPASKPLRTVQCAESEPLESGCRTVEPTVESTVENTVNEPLNAESIPQSIAEQFTEEDIQKEMMRRVMSDLGKKSAESRRKKKI